MKIPSVPIRSVQSFTSSKNGKTYYVALAEIPSDDTDSWSSIRLTCMSDKPMSCKVGEKKDIFVDQYDSRQGVGRFHF